MANFVFWEAGKPGDKQKAVDNALYFIWRSKAEANGKPKFWDLMTKTPVSGAMWADAHAEADALYFYRVAEATSDAAVTEGKAESLTAKVAGADTAFSISTMVATAEGAKVSVPGISWGITSLGTKRDGTDVTALLNFTVRRWVRSKAEPFNWYLITVDVQGLPEGSKIGGPYRPSNLFGEKPTIGDEINCVVKVQKIENGAFADADAKTCKNDIPPGDIDFSTGLTFDGAGKAGAVKIRDAKNVASVIEAAAQPAAKAKEMPKAPPPPVTAPTEPTPAGK